MKSFFCSSDYDGPDSLLAQSKKKQAESHAAAGIVPVDAAKLPSAKPTTKMVDLLRDPGTDWGVEFQVSRLHFDRETGIRVVVKSVSPASPIKDLVSVSRY